MTKHKKHADETNVSSEDEAALQAAEADGQLDETGGKGDVPANTPGDQVAREASTVNDLRHWGGMWCVVDANERVLFKSADMAEAQAWKPAQ